MLILKEQHIHTAPHTLSEELSYSVTFFLHFDMEVRELAALGSKVKARPFVHVQDEPEDITASRSDKVR